MKHSKIILILVIGLSTFLTASGQDSLRIDNIYFDSLNRTKPVYLNRFLRTQPGDLFDQAIVEEDLQRLRNLQVVTDVVLHIDTVGNKLDLHIIVDEAFTLFPIVGFGGIKDNVWIRVGFNQLNLAGKGMNLSGYYQNFDKRNNFNVFYSIPYLAGSSWGASVGFMRFASIEPLYFDELTVPYRYTNVGASLESSYEITHNQRASLGFSYFNENYRIAEDSLLGNSPGPDSLQVNKALVRTAYKNNHINYHFFYLKGWDFNSAAQMVYNPTEDSYFFIWINDFRYFAALGKNGNLGFRVRAGISSNEDSPFAPFVLDSYVNIRGSGNRVDRGTAVLVLNTEYRHTVYDKKDFAGQLAAFSDLGSWRNPGGSLDELVAFESVRHFVGLGARLIYKQAFDAVLRVDFGVDIYNLNQRGIVIGFGQYF